MQSQNFQRPMSELFGINTPEPVMINIFPDTNEKPKTNPNYVFDKGSVKLALSFLTRDNDGDGLLLHGPIGCGKTSFIREVLGRMNWPTRMLSWSETSDVCDLVGRIAIDFGDTKFEYGPLPIAMREGHCLVINEIDRGRAGNLVALNDVLDAGNLFIPETGETIVPHPNFRLVCTANSAGTGDRSGMFAGSVRKLDPAFLDRFIFLEAKYLPVEKELEALMNAFPHFSGMFLSKILEFAGKTRVHSETHAFEMPFTTRSVKRFLRLATSYGLRDDDNTRLTYTDLEPAFRAAYLDRLDPNDKEAADTLLSVQFG